MNTIKSYFTLLFICVCTINVIGQVSYGTLYTDATFNKTVDLGKPVGVTGAVLDVTPNGAATYTVPIKVAPGTNQIEPTITLSYSSQAGGNGIAGWGWNISGLSAIVRSPKNNFLDEETAPVKFTLDDVFSIDGQRLFINSGTYGTNGATYNQEQINFATITSHGAHGNGPAYFTVLTKEGSLLEYGNTGDSKFTTDNGTHILMWRLNKVQDVNGNYIEYVYDNAHRDSRILQIKYTGNANATPARLPYNIIDFSYDTRYDVNTMYEGGCSLTQKHLLTEVTVRSQGQNVRKYTLKYAKSELYSYLIELIENGTDFSANKALNSTIFKYGTQENEYNLNNVTINNTPTIHAVNDEIYAGDFNGDGKSDIAIINNSTQNNVSYSSGIEFYKKLSNGTYHYSTTYTTPSNTVNLGVRGTIQNVHNQFPKADFNGDGREEILNVSFSSSANNDDLTLTGLKLVTVDIDNVTPSIIEYNIALPSSYLTSWVATVPGGFEKVMEHNVLVGEFNGDGVADFILITNRDSLINNGTGPQQRFSRAFLYSAKNNFTAMPIGNLQLMGYLTTGNAWHTNLHSSNSYPNIQILDINGDGKSELLCATPTNSQYFEIMEDVDGNYTTSRTILNDVLFDYSQFPGDFNGDGKGDLLTYHYIAGWNILESDGKIFHSKNPPTNFPFGLIYNSIGQQNSVNIADKISVSDFNGDGKSDILHIRNGEQLNLFYSNGISFDQFNTTLSPSPLVTQPNNQGEFPSNNLVVGDVDGDGRADVLLKSTVSGFPIANLNFRRGGLENSLVGIIDGYSNKETIEYKRLTEGGFYTSSGLTMIGSTNYLMAYNNIKNLQAPLTVVTKLIRPDGLGGTNEQTFEYENLKIHTQSRGLLGFQKFISSSVANNLKVEIQFLHQSNYFIPQVQTTISSSINPYTLLSEVTNSYAYQNYIGKLFQSRLYKVFGINHLQQTYTNKEVISYDYWGNPTKVENRIYKSGSYSTPVELSISETTYGSPLGNSINTHVVSSKYTAYRNGALAPIGETSFTYDAKGLLTQKVDYVNLANPITSSFTYDANGNLLSSATAANGVAGKKKEFEYESAGRFIKKEKNSTIPFNSNFYSERQFYTDNKFGLPIWTTDEYGTTTSQAYDEYGRTIQTNYKLGSPEAFTTTKQYNWTSTIPGALFTVNTLHPGAPDEKVYFDKLGRNIRTETEAPNGLISTETNSYNNKGQLISSTAPYFINEVPFVTTYSYDALNRLSTESTPLVTNTYTYTFLNGNARTTITNQSGQSKSNTTDPAGRLIESTDQGGTLTFEYNGLGNKTRIYKSNTAVEVLTYNQYNRLISKEELNSGTTSYTYDNLGQLVSQTDAMNQSFTYEYDPEGKLTSKTNPNLGTTSYTYNVGLGNGHELTQVTNYNGDIEQFEYDGFGRINLKTDIINGQTFLTATQYDQYDNVTNTIYPSSLEIENKYSNGFYTETIAHTSTSSSSLYVAGQYNGYGQPLDYNLGNGTQVSKQYVHGFNTKHSADLNGTSLFDMEYTFDYSRGNMLYRKDVLKNQEETFGYDIMDRLTSAQVTGGSLIAFNYTGGNSTQNGNLILNSHIGNFGYANNKHALSMASQSDPNCPSGVVCPYILPNVISENEQNITYTPFKRPSTIEEDVWHLSYTYGDHYNRTLSVLSNTSTNEVVTKYYVGNYEERVTQAGGVQKIHYVSGGDGLCAIITMDAQDGTKIHYGYTDHLGSIVLVTDDQGNKEAEQSFDVWGRERDAYDWNNYTLSNTPPTWLYRGYTGHEMLPEFALINMNARLYDPTLGRMLTPDEYLADPTNTQDYNKYSYARNNPLRYTDPSGHVAIWDDVIVGAAGFAFGYVSSGIRTGNWGWKSIGAGVVGAGVALLSYYTAGGFALAAGGTTTTGVTFAAKYLATSIVNSFLPRFTIYKDQAFNLSISPTVGMGSSGMTMGATLNATVISDGLLVNMGISAGFNSGLSSLGGETSGIGYLNVGSFVGYNNGGSTYGVGYSFNSFFGGESDQVIGAIHGQIGKFGFRLDEDSFGDGGDKYRTGGLLMTYQVNEDLTLAFGGSFLTGDPNKGNRLMYGNMVAYYKDGWPGGTYDNCGEKLPTLRGGIMYGGVIYKGQSFFVGHNSTKRLHKIQNWIHDRKWIGTAYFEHMRYKSRPYNYYGSYNPLYLFY